MSWTEQCTESSVFKVKNTKEVKEVLSTMGFDVYGQDNEVYFFGDENVWFDENTEVVLSLEPIEVEGETKNLIGLISDQICEPVDLDSLEEGTYMVVPIVEYLQDQLVEGSYISITCVGYTGRNGGNSEPFGDVTVITKNNSKFMSLRKAEKEILKELGIEL